MTALRHRSILLTSLATLAVAPPLLAQGAYDCTDLELEYYDPDYPYTDQELAALRSEELRRGLGEMEACQQQESSASGGAGGGGGAGQGAGGASGSGASGATGSQGAGPVAGNVRGTDAPSVPSISARTSREAREARRAVDQEEITLGDPPPQTNGATPPDGNGSPPQRIRGANNDDAVAAQIRKAAEAETDPARQQALWDEYYRYTGRSRPPPAP